MAAYCLTISYPIDLLYCVDCYGRSFDEKVEQTVGREADGSGAGDGVRDMTFRYRSQRLAQDAVRRAQKLLKKHQDISIELHCMEK